LKIDQRPHVLAVPVEAVPQGTKTVLVVNPDHRLEERAITLGLETATLYEVTSGLADGDLVMIGNSAQLRPGQTVQLAATEPLARQ
jgi:hypothetical protein